MMGRQEAPAQLFCGFDLERHVPVNHMLREIDLFFDCDGLRDALRPFYGHLGRPSIDPDLIIRMLVIGYADHLGTGGERSGWGEDAGWRLGWGLLFGSLDLRKPDFSAQTWNIRVQESAFSGKSPYSAMGPVPS